MRYVLAIYLLISFLLAGCADDTEPTKANDFVELSAISISPEYPRIADQTKAQMTAIGNFSDLYSANINGTVVWNSSDYNVATIDASSGLLTAVAPGPVDITASRAGINGTLTGFEVTNAAINSVTLSPTDPTVPLGLTQQFSATGLFDDGTEQKITNVINPWVSYNSTVATIDGNGLATPVDVGTTTIAATFGGTEGTTTLTVADAALESITIEPALYVAEISVGLVQKFTATGHYAGGGTANITSNVTWTSGDDHTSTPSATPGQEGYFVGMNAVVPTVLPPLIYATLGTVKGSSDLNVTDLTLSSITIEPAAPSAIIADEELPLTASGNYSNGEIIDITDNVFWTSSSVTVAEVSMHIANEGLVTGKNVGSTLITATGGGQSNQLTVTVE